MRQPKKLERIIAGVIASKSKDLTLDTGTIGYRDLVDVDKRKDYGGSLSLSGPLSGGGNKSQEKAGNPNELGFSVDGSYSSKNKEGISRATVGEGEIVVRDKAKQKELEESGQTQKLANLNRDLDKAQEVTKDEVTEVNLYVSDTSLRTAFKGVELVGRALEEVAADVFRNTGGETADLKEIGNALKNKNLSMESLIFQLAACGGNQGFNWHDLIFTKAYAADACQIKDNKGNVIRTLKPEEHETCKDIISTLLVNDPNWLDNHKKKFENCSGTECPSLLIPAGEFFEALGRRGAVINGQRAVFVDENGNENHLNTADGSPIYYNPLSGKFFANDADLEIEDSFILASGGIGGTIRRLPLSSVKVATRSFNFKNLQPNQFKGEQYGINSPLPGSKVKYLSAVERQAYKLEIRGGKIYDAKGKLFDTSKATTVFEGGKGKAIFVMDRKGNVYASNYQEVGKFHHSSFLAGKPVASAGEIVVKNGKIIEVTRKSGHYKPTVSQENQFKERLHSGGINTNNISFTGGF